jgi:hypothetical protein
VPAVGTAVAADDGLAVFGGVGEAEIVAELGGPGEAAVGPHPVARSETIRRRQRAKRLKVPSREHRARSREYAAGVASMARRAP